MTLPSKPSVIWNARVDARRRPTLPDEAMRAAGFAVGDELCICVLEEGLMILETPRHVLNRARARVGAVVDGRSVVDEFLAERRVEAGRGE